MSSLPNGSSPKIKTQKCEMNLCIDFCASYAQQLSGTGEVPKLLRRLKLLLNLNTPCELGKYPDFVLTATKLILSADRMKVHTKFVPGVPNVNNTCTQALGLSFKCIGCGDNSVSLMTARHIMIFEKD